MGTAEQVAFLLGLDGVVVGWGPGAQFLLGYEASGIVGQPVSVLVPPEATSAFPRMLRAVDRGEGISTTETMMAEDGTRVEVVVVVSPSRDGSGRVTGARAVLRDVTGEQAEEARGRLAALLESTHDAVYTLDVRGIIRTWNPGAERLFGYVAHEAVGLPGLSLVPDGHHDDARMAIECVLAGEPVQLFETEARRKDAVSLVVSMNLWPVRDRGAQVIAVSVICRELTQERLAEAALAESVVRLRESESLAHVGGWVWDVATGAVQWSEELHRIHGIDPAHFAGTLDAHLRLVHPEDRERLRMAMTNALSRPQPFEAEYRIVRPDGGVRWLHARAEVALAASDTISVAGLRGICQDVTGRERVGLRGEHSDYLRDILRTAQLLELTELDLRQAEALGEIARIAEALLGAVDPLPGRARGAPPPASAAGPVAVAEMVDESIDLLRDMAGARGVVLGVDPDAEGPAWVAADRPRLGQVMLHLVSKAVRHNHPGGRVTISWTTRNDGWVRLEVRDKGDGIPTDRMDALFKSQDGDGNGGAGRPDLALCHQLVTGMGGRVGADSQEGEGSTFWIEIQGTDPPQDQPASGKLRPVRPK